MTLHTQSGGCKVAALQAHSGRSQGAPKAAASPMAWPIRPAKTGRRCLWPWKSTVICTQCPVLRSRDAFERGMRGLGGGGDPGRGEGEGGKRGGGEGGGDWVWIWIWIWGAGLTAQRTPGGCSMASPTTLHIGRPCDWTCTPRALNGPFPLRAPWEGGGEGQEEGRERRRGGGGG